MNICLTNPFRSAQCNCRCGGNNTLLLELIRRESFTKEELDVPASYFEDFQAKNPREIQLIGLKHINLKQASDQIRQQFGKREYRNFKDELAENKKVLAEAKFAHLHNHTQFSVLQSTIGIGPLVAATAKNGFRAVAMTDTANMMGAFHFVSAVMNHNKVASAKNAALVEGGEEPSETEMKPIVGCEFNICENHLDKTKRTMVTKLFFS
jgi:DNA polymerase-3 subunit alpha